MCVCVCLRVCACARAGVCVWQVYTLTCSLRHAELTQELAGSYVVEGAGEEKDGEVPNPTAEPTKAMV